MFERSSASDPFSRGDSGHYKWWIPCSDAHIAPREGENGAAARKEDHSAEAPRQPEADQTPGWLVLPWWADADCCTRCHGVQDEILIGRKGIRTPVRTRLQDRWKDPVSQVLQRGRRAS